MINLKNPEPRSSSTASLGMLCLRWKVCPLSWLLNACL